MVIHWLDGWRMDGGWRLESAGWNEYLMEALTEVRHRASRSTSRYFVLISILELSDFTERLDLFSLLRMLFEDT